MSFADFLEKYRRPFYLPDTGGGAGADTGDDGSGGGDDHGTDGGEADGGSDDGGAGDDEGGQPHRLGLRETIEKAARDSRSAQEGRDQKTGQYTKGAKKAATQGQQGQQQEQTQQGQQGQQGQAASDMPAGFPKEVAAEWANTPPAVQQAILKRIADQDKGVADLKNRYTSIDKALEPHQETMRGVNVTPAQAIERMFSWFNAISKNPVVAFPALAKSFNFDWEKLRTIGADGKVTQQGATQGQQGQPGQEGQVNPADIPPAVQGLIDKLSNQVNELQQQLGGKVETIEQRFVRESQDKTNEMVAQWANAKPHYEEVRNLMAQLIGSGAVPLKDGRVDLDGAYEMAIYANPTVRAKIAAEEQAKAEKARQEKAAADAKAQRERVQNARNAGSSLKPAAPGVTGATAAASKKATQRKSVRESIMEAFEQSRD